MQYTYMLTSAGVDIFVPELERLATVSATHPRYAVLVSALLEGTADLQMIQSYISPNTCACHQKHTMLSDWIAGEVGWSCREGSLWYKELKAATAIQRTVEQYMSYDFTRVSKFFSKLIGIQDTPGALELLKWIGNNALTIMDDGTFLAYKSVTADFKDHHTRTFDNSVGRVVKIDRVDPNPDRTCSYGLHVANYEYASTFGGSGSKLLIVAVDPGAVVAVPNESNTPKIRVTSYTVMACVGKEQDITYLNRGVVSATDALRYCEEITIPTRIGEPVSKAERAKIIEMYNQRYTTEALAAIFGRVTQDILDIVSDIHDTVSEEPAAMPKAEDTKICTDTSVDITKPKKQRKATAKDISITDKVVSAVKKALGLTPKSKAKAKAKAKRKGQATRKWDRWCAEDEKNLLAYCKRCANVNAKPKWVVASTKIVEGRHSADTCRKKAKKFGY